MAAAAARHRLVLLWCVVVFASLAAGFDVEGGRAPASALRRPPGAAQPPGSGVPLGAQPPQGPLTTSAPGGAVAGAKATVSRWVRMYTNFVAGAAKVSQLISFGCGFWLTFSSPFALVFSALSGSLIRGQNAYLCLRSPDDRITGLCTNFTAAQTAMVGNELKISWTPL